MSYFCFISQLKIMLISTALIRKFPYKNIINQKQFHLFSQNKKYKIIEDPKEASKLIFQNDGKCRIFQHKDGEAQLKWIIRVGSFFTVLNSILTGIQFASPIFGIWNQISFGVCTGLGYFMLMVFQKLSKRTIKRIQLHNTLDTVDVTFFNAFWKPTTITFHLSEFQQPEPSYAGFTKIDLTSIGKAWIKLQKNEFRNIKDYEGTLDSILLGKPIENLNIVKRKNKLN